MNIQGVKSIDWNDSNEVNVEAYDDRQYGPSTPATSPAKSYFPGGATPPNTHQYTKYLASDFNKSIKWDKKKLG